MLGVDHDTIILLSTPFPTIPMLGKHCCHNVIVFYVGNKRCCIVLYCIVLYCTSETEIYSNYTHTTPTDHYAQSTKQRCFEEIIFIFSSSSRPRIGPTYYTLPSGVLLSVDAAAENRYWKSDVTSAEQAPAVVPVSTLYRLFSSGKALLSPVALVLR